MIDYLTMDYAPLFRAYEKETITKAVVGEVSGKGHQVFVFGFPAFLPSTQENPDESFATGQEVDVCIIKIMPETNNIVVSARVANEKKSSIDAEKLEVGSIVTAKIKNLTKFGAFASIGKVDGLIHVTELSYSRFNDPSEVVTVGQEIPVKILSISEEDENGRRKVELSHKQALPDPWDSITISVGDVVDCVVSRIMDYGLFVTINGVDAMVHKSEFSWDQKNPDPRSFAKIGDFLKVRILSLDRENKKMAASVREVYGDPWKTLDIEPGDVIEAIIVNKTNFGLFLRIAEGIEGLLHNNDLAWNKPERDSIRDSLDVGDTVHVVLLSIDKDRRRLTFSMKHLESEL